MIDLLGLDEVAVAAYRMWLRDDHLTVEDIGKTLGVPVPAVRRARDRLVELSLLLASTDRPGRVVAVHPEAPFEHLLRVQHEQLIRRHEVLVRARAQLGALVSDFQHGSGAGCTDEVVERLDSCDAMRARLFALLSTAEREVLTLHSRPGWQAALAQEVARPEIRALRRGVVMRKILPRQVEADAISGDYMHTVASYGLELRVTDDPALDVIAVDGRCVVVLPAEGLTEGSALLVHARALTNLAVALFDQVWKLSEPLGTDGGLAAGGQDAPSPQERTLLRLLSLGAKDEAAARHLGVSVRTVRRMIADLMRRLDARSRFQAGILAAQRGWL